jgi:hypothetical protein
MLVWLLLAAAAAGSVPPGGTKPSGAIERIWILRHCDKPPAGPCCSPEGYARADAWGAYLARRVPAEATVLHIEAGASSPRQCHAGATPSTFAVDARCQRSERLLLTSRVLQGALARPFTVQAGLCTGDAPAILRRLTKEPAATDAVIVWEHTEIAALLTGLGWPGVGWPDAQHYDFVFLVTPTQLYWDRAPLPHGGGADGTHGERDERKLAAYPRIPAGAPPAAPPLPRLADAQAYATSMLATIVAATASVCAVLTALARIAACVTRAENELEALPLLTKEAAPGV